MSPIIDLTEHSFRSLARKERAKCIGQIPRIKKAQRKKNLRTNPSFLHKGPKNGVEQEYDIHFGQILATKIRNGFLCSNLPFLP